MLLFLKFQLGLEGNGVRGNAAHNDTMYQVKYFLQYECTEIRT